MTKLQAQEISDLLKSGKQYKQGHYHYGYEYFWYVESSSTFMYKKEDLAMDMFNPEITEVELSEESFLAKLVSNHRYSDLVENLS